MDDRIARHRPKIVAYRAPLIGDGMVGHEPKTQIYGLNMAPWVMESRARNLSWENVKLGQYSLTRNI